MSANNFLLIKRIGDKEEYEVTHRDADTDVVMGKPIITNDLSKAVQKALPLNNKIEDEGGYVEYGIRFKI